MIPSALIWVGNTNGYLELVDQRLLPQKFVKLQCRDTKQLYDAIRTLAVRGAPAIGVAAAYGVVLALQKLEPDIGAVEALEEIEKACQRLASSRPTAVNLFWALDRVKEKAKDFIASESSSTVKSLCRTVFDEANMICREDIDMCLRIGQNGQKYIKEGAAVLTHCNAGALATAGQGTAMSVLYEAQKSGKKFRVFVGETRPLLQGARLTAWELKQVGIGVTLICDNVAGWLMKQGKIDVVITGADRIAANGDVANKIGTYSLAVLAKHNNIPFYVAAPSSTFDLNIKTGSDIPIEQRPADEVATFAGTKVAPEDIDICNPAFDVTDASLISAIVTEKGFIENPTVDKIVDCLGKH